jgi:hypothetical protein
MKRITFVLGTVLLAVGAITLSSFVSKSFKHNAFATQCYYYNGNNQRIATGTSGQIDQRENSIDVDLLTTPGNWINTAPNPPTSGDCTGGGYICAICFNLDANSDGDNANGLTLQEAINILGSYYSTNSTLPAQGGNVNTATGAVTAVNVYRQPTVLTHN